LRLKESRYSIKGKYLGEGVVELSPKASTKTRLHELAHKKFGHEPGRMSVDEFVDKEIDAEKWAWETMDRKLTHRVGLPALMSLIDDYNFSDMKSLNIVIRRLKAKGIPVSMDGREDLARFV